MKVQYFDVKGNYKKLVKRRKNGNAAALDTAKMEIDPYAIACSIRPSVARSDCVAAELCDGDDTREEARRIASMCLADYG